MNKWRKIRISLYAIIFVGNFVAVLLESRSPTSEIVFDWQMMILSLFFPALVIPLLIFVQSGAPYVAEKWTVPTLDTKLFTFSDPLHFFHFASHCFGIGGISVILASLLHDLSRIGRGVNDILFGLGLYLGVILCRRMCRRKYQV